MRYQVKFWQWLGRLAPLTGLLAIALTLYFNPANWTDYIIIIIAVSFGTIAFAWWWWVIFAVKHLTEMLSKSRDDFMTIITEIGDLKREINKGRRNKIVRDSDNIIPLEKELNYSQDDE